MGWKPRQDVELRLVVHGVARDPVKEGGAAAFLFPADATDVRLTSNTFEPRSAWRQRRTHAPRAAEGSRLLGDPRRAETGSSWRTPDCATASYNVEGRANRWRWTNGELVLDPQLWGALSGTVCLFVAYAHGAVRGWTAPARHEREASQIERKPKLYAIR